MKFSEGQVMKSAWMNVIANRIDEVIDVANLVPKVDELSKSNYAEIEVMKSAEVDISESEFEALQASGQLDPSKTYYVYEEA